MSARRVAYVFPGQGSQKVGMGRAWAEVSPAARATLAEVDAVLGWPLTWLCWEGPEEELNLTANTQPALLAVSTAIHRALAAAEPPAGFAAAAWPALPPPVAMAGHSLGEYSALVAAGALDFAAALRLVRRRGELMQEAVPVGEGAMAAFLGLDAAAAAAVARDAEAAVPRDGGAAGAHRAARPAGAGRHQRRRRPGDHRRGRPRCAGAPDRQPGALGGVGRVGGGHCRGRG